MSILGTTYLIKYSCGHEVRDTIYGDAAVWLEWCSSYGLCEPCERQKNDMRAELTRREREIRHHITEAK